jgi:transposase
LPRACSGIAIVKSYIHDRQLSAKEMFVPLHHPTGHAQVDFGEAMGLIGGVARKLHFFCMDLPHSDAIFVKAYPAETIEAFLDGHVAAFDFFGKLPLSILYDNTALAVAAILGDGRRQRTRAFTELQSHYLFEDRFGRPGKGNDKGKVEGLVGYHARSFLACLDRRFPPQNAPCGFKPPTHSLQVVARQYSSNLNIRIGKIEILLPGRELSCKPKMSGLQASCTSMANGSSSARTIN